MTIQANFPNVQPSLLLDFANAKQLPPQVTFTRATSAAYYDGSTTAMAEQNLYLQSQTFDNSPWGGTELTVTGNVTTAPDGTNTADSIVPNTVTTANHQFSQTVSVLANTTYTVSIYVKAFGYSKFAFRESIATGAYATFDLASTGSVTSTGNVGAISILGATITSVGSGWFRTTVTFTSSVASAYGLAFFSLNDTYTSGEPYNQSFTTGDGTSGVYIWGAQTEQRATATAYTATTTQPITTYVPVLLTANGGQPRFDHNPTTSESLGLLIEEQRTNLVFRSVYAGSNWSVFGGTLTQNYTIAPDGSQTACQVFSTGFVTTRIDTGALVSGITYAASIWMKSNTSSNQTIAFQIGDNTVQSCTVTPQWQRFIGVGTPTASGYNFLDLESIDSNISVWGAQLEQASFATSYIPTTGAAATRAADFASMTGANFSSWFNNSQGTFVAIVGAGNVSTGARVLKISDTDSNRLIDFYFTATPTQSIFSFQNNITSADFSAGAINTSKYLTAVSYKTGNISALVNGGSVTTSTIAVVSSIANSIFSIGYDPTSGGGQLSRPIAKIAYYPLQVTSAQLQALTS